MCLATPLLLTVSTPNQFPTSDPFYLEDFAPASPQPSFRPHGPAACEPAPGDGDLLAACHGPVAHDAPALSAGKLCTWRELRHLRLPQVQRVANRWPLRQWMTRWVSARIPTRIPTPKTVYAQTVYAQMYDARTRAAGAGAKAPAPHRARALDRASSEEAIDTFNDDRETTKGGIGRSVKCN